MRPAHPDDTIAAVATPPGVGAVGIVRLSGPEAIAITASIFASSSSVDLRRSRRRVFYGTLRDGVDEVLVHVMRAPHSYTREDVVEINCHGGPLPVQETLALVLGEGARLAEPGEFTRRAFMNGRIDLVQAEAVIDRIQSRTRAGLRAAATAASGALSERIDTLHGEIVDSLAQAEAAVDMAEQDLPEDLLGTDWQTQLAATRRAMQDLLDTAHAGRLLIDGARLAIIGRPNVGKSSLFNALLRDTRAIVTSQPGTTRDLLEETLNLEGIPVRLLDTAGMREAEDEVERIGVDRARNALQQADLVLVVTDATDPFTAEDLAIAQEAYALEVPLVLAVNKVDLAPDPPACPWDIPFAAVCPLSAQTGNGLHTLEIAMHAALTGGGAIAPEQALITRTHQQDSLRRALAAIDRVLAHAELSPELLAVDLQEAVQALGEITGETTPDDILGRIFSSFCIGK